MSRGGRALRRRSQNLANATARGTAGVGAVVSSSGIILAKQSAATNIGFTQTRGGVTQSIGRNTRRRRLRRRLQPKATGSVFRAFARRFEEPLGLYVHSDRLTPKLIDPGFFGSYTTYGPRKTDFVVGGFDGPETIQFVFGDETIESTAIEDIGLGPVFSPIRRDFASAYEPLTFDIDDDGTIVETGDPFDSNLVWTGFDQCTTLTNSDILVQNGSWNATSFSGQKDGPTSVITYRNIRTGSPIDPADYGLTDVVEIANSRIETQTTSRAGDVTVPLICPAGSGCTLGQTGSGQFSYPEITRDTTLVENRNFTGQSASAKIKGLGYILTPGTVTYTKTANDVSNLRTTPSTADYNLVCTPFGGGDMWQGTFSTTFNGDRLYDLFNSSNESLRTETIFHVQPDVTETLVNLASTVQTFTETVAANSDYTFNLNSVFTDLVETIDWAKPTVDLDGAIYKKVTDQDIVTTVDIARAGSTLVFNLVNHSPTNYDGFLSSYNGGVSDGTPNITRDRTFTTDRTDSYQIFWVDSDGSVPLKISEIDNSLRGAIAGSGIDLQSVTVGQLLILDVTELAILAKPTQEIRTDVIVVGSGTTPQPTVITKTQLPFWDEFIGMEFRLSQLASSGSNRFRKLIATVDSYDFTDTLLPEDFSSNDMRTITQLRLRVDRIIGTELFDWRLPPDETDTDLIHYVAQGGYIEHALFNSAFSTESSTDNRSSIVKAENEPDVLARIFYANSSPNPDNLSQWGVPAIFTIMSNGDVIRRDRSIKGGIFKIPAAFNFTDPFTVHYTRAD